MDYLCPDEITEATLPNHQSKRLTTANNVARFSHLTQNMPNWTRSLQQRVLESTPGRAVPANSRHHTTNAAATIVDVKWDELRVCCLCLDIQRDAAICKLWFALGYSTHLRPTQDNKGPVVQLLRSCLRFSQKIL